MPVIAIAVIATCGTWFHRQGTHSDVGPDLSDQGIADDSKRESVAGAVRLQPDTPQARLMKRLEEGEKANSAQDGNEAARYYFAAFSIAGRQLAKTPGDREWQDHLNLAFRRLNDALISSGGSPEARRFHDDARVALEHLVQANPEVSQWQSSLLHGYDRVAKMADRNGDLAEARQFNERALEIAKDQALKAPDDPYGQWSVASSSFALVDIALRSGDNQGARNHLDLARSQAEQALQLGDDSFDSKWSEVFRQLTRNLETRLSEAETGHEGEPILR